MENDNASYQPEPIKVVRNENNGGGKKVNPYIIAVVAVLIVATAVIITVCINAKKKKDIGPEDTVKQEPTADDVPADDITLINHDIEVDLSNITDEYAQDLLDHMETTTVTTAIKPTVTTVTASEVSTSRQPTTAAQQKPVKPEHTTVKTTQPAQVTSPVIKQIEGFFNGKYYIDGTMITGNDKMLLELAMDGENFQVFSEIDGMDISFLRLNGKTYLLNPANKKYTELTAMVMRTLGIDEDAFNFAFTNLKFDGAKPAGVFNATYDGKPAKCYSYRNDSTKVDFYEVNNKIVRIELNSDDGSKTIIDIDEFSADIPGGMITLKGYSKTNLISFFTALMD